MDIFAKIAETRICKAIEDGQFDDLSGKGKPIILEDETWIPEDLRMACRLLKNAGLMPPELEIRGDLINLYGLLDKLDDDKERLRKMRELNLKVIKLNMLRGRPLRVDDECRLIERLIPPVKSL
jgi:hypothetical protein